MYFRCSIKLSPCITKYLAYIGSQFSELVSRFKQVFSDKSSNRSDVREMGIFCTASCNSNNKYLAAGMKKIEEMDLLKKKDWRTLRTSSKFICGNDGGHTDLAHNDNLSEESSSEDSMNDVSKLHKNKLNPETKSRGEKSSSEDTMNDVSKLQKKKLKPKTKSSEEKRDPQNYVFTKKQSNDENAKLKVKLDMTVQARIGNSPPEKDVESGITARNSEAHSNAKKSFSTDEIIDKNNEDSYKSAVYNQDGLLKEDVLEDKLPTSHKSDEMEKDMTWYGINVTNKEDMKTESEILIDQNDYFNSELPDQGPKVRTESEEEYQRFIDEFSKFKK